jgi:hypothetical protein
MSVPDEITTVRGHILQGERHVARQQAIITRLRELGADTGLAEELLYYFEASLEQHQAHLSRLLRP